LVVVLVDVWFSFGLLDTLEDRNGPRKPKWTSGQSNLIKMGQRIPNGRGREVEGVGEAPRESSKAGRKKTNL
jgi:hypothetical protein